MPTLRWPRGHLASTSKARPKLSVHFTTATKNHAWFDPTRNYSRFATPGEGTVVVSLSSHIAVFPDNLFSGFCHTQTKFAVLTSFSAHFPLKSCHAPEFHSTFMRYYGTLLPHNNINLNPSSNIYPRFGLFPCMFLHVSLYQDC